MITSLTEYAQFWRRFMANLADIFWISLLLIPLLFLSYGSEYLELTENFELWERLGWQDFLITDVLPALFVLLFWTKYSATPGKWLFDCEIVDAQTGQAITFKQAVIRYFSYLISFLPLCLGFLWIFWDKRKQGWHDKIAGTVVIIHDEAVVPLHQLDRYYR